MAIYNSDELKKEWLGLFIIAGGTESYKDELLSCLWPFAFIANWEEAKGQVEKDLPYVVSILVVIFFLQQTIIDGCYFSLKITGRSSVSFKVFVSNPDIPKFLVRNYMEVDSQPKIKNRIN